MRILAFSDCHLGITTDYTAFHRFLDLAKAEKPDLLLGVGDVVELIWRTWDEVKAQDISAGAVNHLRDVASVVPTRLMKGNHDAELSAVAAELAPAAVEPEGSITLDGVEFTHGHQWDPMTVHVWDKVAGSVLRRILPALYVRLYGTPLQRKQAGDQQYSRIIWLITSQVCMATADRPVVFGHTHAPLRAELPRGKVLGNTGDFIDSCSYLDIRDGGIQLKWV